MGRGAEETASPPAESGEGARISEGWQTREYSERFRKSTPESPRVVDTGQPDVEIV
jgi:hypothetical protein